MCDYWLTVRLRLHPCIDGIVVVCVEGWEEILKAYCRQFNIIKLYDIASQHQKEDLILIYDAIRPMVSEEIISDCIRVAG